MADVIAVHATIISHPITYIQFVGFVVCVLFILHPLNVTLDAESTVNHPFTVCDPKSRVIVFPSIETFSVVSLCNTTVALSAAADTAAVNVA